MKKKLSYFLNLVCLFVGIFVFSQIQVQASDSDIVYSDYNFVTKRETFGHISSSMSLFSNSQEKMDIVKGYSQGYVGDLPFETEEGESISPNSVIGEDDRFVINDTTKLPMRWIGYVLSYWPDGRVTRGTAWLYGESVAMTAGHVIYDYENQTYPNSITFSPGYNNGNAPYGTYSVVRARVTRQYYNDRNIEGDVGIMKLSSPVGRQVGYFSFEYNNNINAYNNYTVGITGYPADKGYKMYGASGKILEAYQRRFHYQIDTYGGQSGSPIFYKDSNDTNNRICIGVHTHGSDGTGDLFTDRPENSGVRIFQTMFNWMKNTQIAYNEDVDPPLFSDGTEFWA